MMDETSLPQPTSWSMRLHLNHIRPVVIQVPKLAIVTLVSPPERVLPQNLVLFEVRPHSPTLVVRERMPILSSEAPVS